MYVYNVGPRPRQAYTFYHFHNILFSSHAIENLTVQIKKLSCTAIRVPYYGLMQQYVPVLSYHFFNPGTHSCPSFFLAYIHIHVVSIYFMLVYRISRSLSLFCVFILKLFAVCQKYPYFFFCFLNLKIFPFMFLVQYS